MYNIIADLDGFYNLTTYSNSNSASTTINEIKADAVRSFDKMKEMGMLRDFGIKNNPILIVLHESVLVPDDYVMVIDDEMFIKHLGVGNDFLNPFPELNSFRKNDKLKIKHVCYNPKSDNVTIDKFIESFKAYPNVTIYHEDDSSMVKIYHEGYFDPVITAKINQEKKEMGNG